MILDRLKFIERLREDGFVFGELNISDGTYYDAISLDDINRVLDDIISNGDRIIIEKQKDDTENCL
jgi:hypothetical protein